MILNTQMRYRSLMGMALGMGMFVALLLAISTTAAASEGQQTDTGMTAYLHRESVIADRLSITPSLPFPADGETRRMLDALLGWSGGDPDGGPITYTVALGTDPNPPVVGTVGITGCNPSGGLGGQIGQYETTIAGLPVAVWVSSSYDPAKPNHLSFYLHGDDIGGNGYRAPLYSSWLDTLLTEKGWVFVSPQAKARSSDGAHSWYAFPHEHIAALTQIFEEMYSKYNLCRNALFGASASAGSVFWAREWFPRKGATYPAHVILNCGSGGLKDSEAWDLDEMARSLGQNPDVNARSLFHFAYGPDDFLFDQIQETLAFYTSAGFRVVDGRLAGEGHCTWDIFKGTAHFWDDVAGSAPRYQYNPGTLAANEEYYWQVIADDGTGQQPGPIWKFRVSSVINLPLVSARLGQPLDTPTIRIPAGHFQMGCTEDGSCQEDEQPLRTVYLSSYSIDQYEVTNARYQACVDAMACTPPKESSSWTRANYYGNPLFANFPVLYVEWGQAKTYCAWEGKRLPTEAEWEKAARGSQDARLYPWGSQSPTCTLANLANCSADTTRVGSYPTGVSPYGLHDMTGNVGEWVADRYDPSYYTYAPSSDPPGPDTSALRSVRGGGWSSSVESGRIVDRAAILVGHPSGEFSYPSLGFRCARSE